MHVPLLIFSRTPKPLVDKQDRIFGVLAGHPSDPDWPQVVDTFNDAFRGALFKDKADPNKRGSYNTIHAGVSYGFGQRVSMPSLYFIVSPTNLSTRFHVLIDLTEPTNALSIP